jgi:probable addiction module antidote protein/putative addiction module killer protein
MNPIEIRQYQTAGGRIPFSEWFAALGDRQAITTIAARLTRMQSGNRGDWKSVGAGVIEQRMDAGPGYRVYCGKMAQSWYCCCVAATSGPKRKTSSAHMNTGKTTRHAASVPFHLADHLEADDIPGYLAGVIHDGDTRALPLALREAAEVLGMAELSRRTGLNRETLYRTLSERGNPRLDTLATILDAFGLRLAVEPLRGKRRVA